MAGKIKLLLWNANGILQHRREVIAILTEQAIDIMLISETHFTDKSYLQIPGYEIYTTEHPDGTAHGGTAVIIRKTIKHHELTEYKTEEIQATSVMITENGRPLTLTAVYCPPKHQITEDQFTTFLKTLGRRFIAGGDYNAKHQQWGSRLNTLRGKNLLKAINKLNVMTLSTGEPSYWPTDMNKTPDLLDLFLAKGIIPATIKIKTNYDLSSDHTPVEMTICSSVIERRSPPKLCSKFTNWEKFRIYVNNSLSVNMSLKSSNDIDTAVLHLTEVIRNAAWRATPKSEIIKNLPYPKEIRQKITEKRRLRRIYMYTRQPEDKKKFNASAQQLKRELKEYQNTKFSNYVNSLTPTAITNYSLWKATKKTNQPQQHISPIRRQDGTWARSPEEKAECLAIHFSTVFQPIAKRSITENEVIESLQAPLQQSAPIKAFNLCEIEETIKKHINPTKSPGHDLITGTILQELPKEALSFVTSIFNAIISESHYPTLWKYAQVIAIAKPGKPATDVASYRPISLLPVLSKVFEKLLLQRLKPITNNIIPDFQYGFREGHSTIDQTHRIVNKISQSLEEKKYCSAAFLDVQQAFDRVWHAGLLFKIKQLLPHSFYSFFKTYLSSRFFQIKYQDVFSGFKPQTAGVPQGSILGPILYVIYTSDLPTTEHTMMATFADDTAILAVDEDSTRASQHLQAHLDKIEEWTNQWRVNINTAKSQQITFSLRKEQCPKVKLNSSELSVTTVVRYLGLHLDSHLTWKPHILKKRKESQLKLSKLSWLLNRRSKLSLYNKILVYKTIIKPIWTYGIELWGTASKSNLEILRRFETKTLRYICNAPWFVTNNNLYKDLNISTMSETISERSKRHQMRLESHPNQHSVNMLDNSEHVYRLKREHILDLPFRFSS